MCVWRVSKEVHVFFFDSKKTAFLEGEGGPFIQSIESRSRAAKFLDLIIAEPPQDA